MQTECEVTYCRERESLSYCSEIRALCCLLFACVQMKSGLAGIKYLHVRMYVALEGWKLIGRKQLRVHPRGSKCSNCAKDMCTHALLLDNVDTTRSYSRNEKKIIVKREENCPISIVTCP